jgi:hypothetical protein
MRHQILMLMPSDHLLPATAPLLFITQLSALIQLV